MFVTSDGPPSSDHASDATAAAWPQGTCWRGSLRTALGRALQRTGLLRAGLREAGVVVAFHRVNDGPGDALTRSSRDYEAFCRFFRQEFDVVPLSAIIARLEKGRSIAGMLAITHDDGYLDNYEVAAPILDRFGLPATFFVSSGFVGTERVASWDADAGRRFGWMDWDQVRTLREAGFTIGAHTVNHADLGVVSPNVARRELVKSREKIEAELGEPVDLFAYPFGGEANMSETNRELVKTAGYRCCFSCHGGIVDGGADPYRLGRVPITDWYGNPDQLAAALGLRRA